MDALSRETDLRPAPTATPRQVRVPDDDYLVALAEATGAVIVAADDDLFEADLTPPGTIPSSAAQQQSRTASPTERARVRRRDRSG